MARANLKRLEEGKLYYSISEVCAMTGLEQHVLRYWESEFPQLRPKKNRSGNRAYRSKEIKIIRYIKYLLYDELYTIPGAKKKMAEADISDLDGQLTLLRVPPSPPSAQPAAPAPAAERRGSAPDDEESASRETPHPPDLPEPAPGPEAAAEETRLRGELLRVKSELKAVLAVLGRSDAGARSDSGAPDPERTEAAGRRSS